MLAVRVIPVLLYKKTGLVKSIKFQNYKYIGDAINAIKIFNEKEVDEIILLDIEATSQNRGPNFHLIADIASECFMPLGYGGGITSLLEIEKIFKLGAEKVSINNRAIMNPQIIEQAAKAFGSQSIVVSIDVKKTILGNFQVFNHISKKITKISPVNLAKSMETLGAGELLINSVDQDGTMEGYNVELLKKITEAVNIPVIACGGAGKLQDFSDAVRIGGASAVAAGSMFVYYGKHRAVLINYPTQKELTATFSNNFQENAKYE